MNAIAGSLERRALSLGTANAIDYALQFLLPIVLTRALDAEGFGRYRLLWLAVGTLMVAPLFMPQSLYYFLPRSDRPTQRLYINQTFFFLVAIGALAAWLLSQWNPFLPDALRALENGHAALVPAFAMTWIVASLLDVLPTVEERVTWQARAILGLSVTRTIALSVVALVTRDFIAVLYMLLAFAIFKLSLLVMYVGEQHGIGGPVLRRQAFVGQLRHAAPFGLSGALFGLRAQADQWVAAALFSVASFASFSVAAVLAPMVQLFRQSVNHVFLPSMSRMHSVGDVAAMVDLNSRANAMVALLVFPLLAFAFVFADPLIRLVYTDTYIDAVPVLRLYVIGLVPFVVELASILLLLRQGPFAARVNACALVLSVGLSYWGATHWGLVGAALGSVAMIYLDRSFTLTRIARVTGLPIAKLQDWSCLAAVLAASAVGAAATGLVMTAWQMSAFATLGCGAMLMAVAYAIALCVLGQGPLMAGLVAAILGSGESDDLEYR